MTDLTSTITSPPMTTWSWFDEQQGVRVFSKVPPRSFKRKLPAVDEDPSPKKLKRKRPAVDEDPVNEDPSPKKLKPTLVSDEPHIQLLFDQLESKLSEGKLHSQRRNKNKSTFSLDWQFGLGRVTNALGATGFTTPHNFLKKGVFMKSVLDTDISAWKKDLWVLAKQLILHIDPGYAAHEDYVVNFSCMTDSKKHYVKRHVDDQDITFQYGLALGDFTGGELTCWKKDGTTTTVDYTRKILKMDGRLAHEVKPFSGKRFCVIFYKLYDRTMTDKAPILEAPYFV